MPFTSPTASPSASVSGTAHRRGESRPSDVVTSRIAAPFSTQGTERSIPPTRTTNVCPAATKPTNEAMTQDRLDARGAREARVQELADDEDQDRRAEGVEHPAPVGREDRQAAAAGEPARPRFRSARHAAHPARAGRQRRRGGPRPPGRAPGRTTGRAGRCCAKKSTLMSSVRMNAPAIGADRAAAPAEEADPAEHDRGDRGEDEHVARRRVAGGRRRGEEEPAGGREGAAETT